ncbi:DUF1016 family protein, partial [archaeon]|nr:DUF1016 family protein [archaeon]
MKSSKNKLTQNKQKYNDLISNIKSILDKSLFRAHKAVDNIKVQTYWQIGERIIREELKSKFRADYGKELFKNLSSDLKISERNLYNIVDFFKTYPILQTVSAELSWSHYVELLKLKYSNERRFYEIKTIEQSLSVRQLKQKIKNKEHMNKTKYKNSPLKRIISLPKPQDIFKDSYDLTFLNLNKNHSEKELEDSIINSIQKTLLEFGNGFAFMSRQQKILIGGNWYKVDLVFYHRFLKCNILVELKTEKFKRDHVAQMNQYLTYFREEDQFEDERDPIGLIICKEKNNEEVHYALGKLRKDIFVAEYKTYLPSETQLKRKIK